MQDDVFSDNEDKKTQQDSNIEWKKNGIDKNERITLKVNVKEANRQDAQKRMDGSKKLKADKSLAPQGFQKIKKKIRGPLDEEEDEEEYILVPVFSMEREESSLIKGLTSEEKKILNQVNSLDNIRLQENIGKQASIAMAEKAVKDLGLTIDKKLVAEKMTDNKKVEAKEVLQETIKKHKPLKTKRREELQKNKDIKEKQQTKAKTTEEHALEQAKRRAEKKNHHNNTPKPQDVTKVPEEKDPVAKAEEEKVVATEQQDKEVVKQEEEKSARELVMEKRGQATASQAKTERHRILEEERKRFLEKQLLQRHGKDQKAR